MTANKIFNFCKRCRWTGDCITTDTNGEDYSWDAVWKSKAIITDFGLIEMRIYAALRFCRKKNKLGT
jgi:hypothetical protein